MVQKYRVKRFFDDRGFGFLRGDKNGDLYFHMSGKHRATVIGNEVRYARTREGRAPEAGEKIIVLETTEINGKKSASKWCFAGQADEEVMRIELSLPMTQKSDGRPPFSISQARAVLDLCVRNSTYHEFTRTLEVEWLYCGRVVAAGTRNDHGDEISLRETANFATTTFDEGCAHISLLFECGEEGDHEDIGFDPPDTDSPSADDIADTDTEYVEPRDSWG